MTDSLYQRLGGTAHIAEIVDDVFDRHAVNPSLVSHFHDKDLPRLKVLGIQFLCTACGGPQKYEGRDVRTAHVGMYANEQELIAAIDDFVAALQAQGVGQTEVNEVVAILYSFKGDVLRT